MKNTIHEKLESIARDCISPSFTFTVENSDGEDFVTLSKWDVEKMMTQAYELGRLGNKDRRVYSHRKDGKK